MVLCDICEKVSFTDTSKIVVVETDTGGTLLSRPVAADSNVVAAFDNRYHALADQGRYPNMSKPHIECRSCREARLRELEEELEYWRSKNPQNFSADW